MYTRNSEEKNATSRNYIFFIIYSVAETGFHTASLTKLVPNTKIYW